MTGLVAVFRPPRVLGVTYSTVTLMSRWGESPWRALRRVIGASDPSTRNLGVRTILVDTSVRMTNAESPSPPPSSLRTAWALTKPYFATRRSYKAWILVVLVVGMNIAIVYCDVLMSDWSRRFFNAAQEKNFALFTRELLIFPLVLVAIISSSALSQFFSQVLRLRWRAWLTRQ